MFHQILNQLFIKRFKVTIFPRSECDVGRQSLRKAIIARLMIDLPILLIIEKREPSFRCEGDARVSFGLEVGVAAVGGGCHLLGMEDQFQLGRLGFLRYFLDFVDLSVYRLLLFEVFLDCAR